MAKPKGLNIDGPESGATGLRQIGGYVREEWLSALVGRRGMQMYREMMDNDPVIGAVMFAFTMLLRGVTFTVEAEDTENPDDKDAADFVTSCIGDMEHSWGDFIGTALTFLGFGWSVHEIVYKVRDGKKPAPGPFDKNPAASSKYDDCMIGWRKFGHRGQETLLKWAFDERGEATALNQLLPVPGPNGTTQCIVPLAKCIHLVTSRNKSNPEGRSVLRTAYTSYFYKKRLQELEVNGAERDLTGLPIAWVPAQMLDKNATQAERSAYAMWKKLVRDTYRNEQEGFVLPLAYDAKGNKKFDFTLLTTGGKRVFDIDATIQRYDGRMAQSSLADFITMGSTGGPGSFAQSKNKTDFFTVACKAFLDMITDATNQRAVPDLLEVNGLKGQCRIVHGDIARRDLTELETYVAGLVAAGVILPDDSLEESMREEADLPASDPDTVRQTAATMPQIDPETGQPIGGAKPPGAKPKAPVAKRRRRGPIRKRL